MARAPAPARSPPRARGDASGAPPRPGRRRGASPAPARAGGRRRRSRAAGDTGASEASKTYAPGSSWAGAAAGRAALPSRAGGPRKTTTIDGTCPQSNGYLRRGGALTRSNGWASGLFGHASRYVVVTTPPRSAHHQPHQAADAARERRRAAHRERPPAGRPAPARPPRRRPPGASPTARGSACPHPQQQGAVGTSSARPSGAASTTDGLRSASTARSGGGVAASTAPGTRGPSAPGMRAQGTGGSPEPTRCRTREIGMSAPTELDPRRWKALALVGAAFFMTVLDVAIGQRRVPTIQDELGLPRTEPAVDLTAYAITFGGFLLLGGRAADLLGRRRSSWSASRSSRSPRCCAGSPRRRGC